MNYRGKDIRFYLAWLASLVAAGLAVYLLMFPPVIGVADNGDFSRVMRFSGFKHLLPDESYEDRYFGYAHQYFGYGPFWGGGYVSTQLLLFTITGLAARIFNSEVFDIRWFGAVYTMLLSGAIYLWVRHAPVIPRQKFFTGTAAAFLGILIIFIFGDIGYLAYFQSFFGEPYAMIGMLSAIGAAVALAVKDQPTGRLLVLFIIASVAVATSKIQNAPLGFAFAVLAWRMLYLSDNRQWRRRVVIGCGTLVVVSAVMIVAAPQGLKHINLYQSIFFGVLKDTPDLSRDMKELGIPEKYKELAGTNFFEKGTAIPQGDPTLRKEVLERLGHKDIALYYLRHPERFVDKLEKAAAGGVFIRPKYLGNYDQSASKPRGALSHSFSSWSDWKVERMPHSLGWFLGFYSLYFAGLVIWWLRASSRRMRLGLEAMAVVGLSGIFSVVVPLIGDGEADLGKHLFMFNVCFDMMVVSAAAALVYGILQGIARGRA